MPSTDAPSVAALAALQLEHVRRYTFDDLDVLLEQHPGVALEAVRAKFEERGRGGYCFEHVTLFADRLRQLGYRLEVRLGRVGPGAAQARTHAVIVVELPGELDGVAADRWLVDPGFGFSLTAPVPLVEGAIAHPGGWEYRVERVPLGVAHGWALWRRVEGDDAGWELAHTHDEVPVHPIDLVAAHHYTSTFPASRFRTVLMVARHYASGELDAAEPAAHVTLTHGAVTIRRPGRATEHVELTLADVADWLHRLAPQLTADEHARVLEVARGFRERDAGEGAARA
ncbi:MAG: arylamine N-acetyltransferase [Actinomycetales bacterium]|nr:arylamine N-acetyltransferase [Actinomycetales bacterium]